MKLLNSIIRTEQGISSQLFGFDSAWIKFLMKSNK